MIDRRTQRAPLMLDDTILDRRAWRRDAITGRDWIEPLPAACVDELDAAIRHLRRDPLPTLAVHPDDFSLSRCAELMGRVRERLLRGVGLAVVDRVPVERYTDEENRAIGWLLGQLLGRPVAQMWTGAMLYDVRDTGKPLEYGVRRSVTNLELTFHTDAAWLALPPELVGLYCINPAREGGVSRFVSLWTVHNELRRHHPDLLPRLYQDYPWDRQAEHAPDDDKVSWRPIFQHDGRSFLARFNEKLIETGASLAGQPLDAEAQEALTAMRSIVDDPAIRVELVIERGQVQYINNRQFAHSRTDFTDAPEPHRKRHLIRLWTRPEGRRSFHA